MLVLVLVAALLAGLVVRTFVLRPLTVSSTSMEPTLCPGDRVLVNLWDPDLGDLARDDLVALRPGRSEVPVVKRVVGLPGDEVAIRDALLYVNDQLVDEPYVDHKSIDSLFYGPVVVPADRFLVLGRCPGVLDRLAGLRPGAGRPADRHGSPCGCPSASAEPASLRSFDERRPRCHHTSRRRLGRSRRPADNLGTGRSRG